MHQCIRPVAMVPVSESVVIGSVQSGDEIEQMPYTPALLLPLPALDVHLLNDSEFVFGCEAGYEDYFDPMYEDVLDAPSTFVFVYRAYTLAEVAQYMQENLQRDSSAFLRFFHVPATTLSYCAGFVFGWLSALAKYDEALAATSLPFFIALVKVVQREEEQAC